MNGSIRPIDGRLTGTATLDKNGPENNANEGLLHIPQSSMTGVLLSDGLVSFPGHLLEGLLLSFVCVCVCVFCF